MARRREVPVRLRSFVAALSLCAALGALHAFALRGYARWGQGRADVEATLARPETFAWDSWLRLASIFEGTRLSAMEPTPVQVVLLPGTSEDPDRAILIARLVTRVRALGAATIVLDLPDVSDARARIASGVIEGMDDPAARDAVARWSASGAEALPAALAGAPVVLGVRAIPAGSARAVIPPGAEDALAQFVARASSPSAAKLGAAGMSFAAFPPHAVLSSAANVAIRYDVEDPDGITRRVPALVAARERSGRRFFATLPIEAVRLATGATRSGIVSKPGALKIGALEVPATDDGFLFVDPREAPAIWSPAEIFSERIHAPSFAHAIVVVGESRARDPVTQALAGPLDPHLSHAELVATIAHEILRGRVPRRLRGWDPDAASLFWQGLGPIATLLLGALGAALALALPGRRGFGGERAAYKSGAVAVLAPAGAWLALAFLLAARERIWIDAFYPAVAAIGGAIAATAADSLLSGAERKMLESVVSRMLPPEVARRALHDPSILALGGASRDVTILFADLRGFTRFSETQPPVQVVKILTEYHTATTRAILVNGGAIDKLMGDGTMAFFGAPEDDPQHPAKAARAALAMLDALDLLNEKWKKAGLPALEMGIGINSGTVIVGNIGTPEIVTYTLLGDAVNIASRLESMNKVMKSNILIGEETARRLGDQFPLRDVGEVDVRGRAGKVRVFELRRVRPDSISAR